LPNYSIGSDFRTIEKILSYEFSYAFDPVFLTHANQRLPIIFSSENGKIDQAVWGMSSDKSKSMIYPWVRMEGIIKNVHSRALIRNNRCLIPANGFFIRNKTDIYFIYFPDEKVITFGAVWKPCKDNDTDNQYITFSIISSPASGKIGQLTQRNPLIIHPVNRRKFLKKEKPLMDITRILKKDHKLDFNGFAINPGLFHKNNISKSDFYPVGGMLNRGNKFPEKAILGSYYYYQS
jgi:putative SOS response-associated peptidase YedK